jgi:LacI family transcriptional regulator
VNKRQPITIKEVAEAAGVSQMTVSRVLNKQKLVKESTRLRVEAAIAALNYRPNLMARGLAGGKSKLIGLAYYNPSPSYLSALLVSALKQCRDLGHHLVIEDLSDIEGDLDNSVIIGRLSSIRLDGLILAPPLSNNQTLLKLMQDMGIPVVALSYRDPGSNHSSVAFDDVAAAFLMTELLIENGHSRIGFIRGPLEHPSARQRQIGYENALKAHDIPVDKSLIFDGDFTFKSGMDLANDVLELKTPPTAIFASNDDMAAGVIAGAQRRGVKVPSELSIVGFDDTAIAAAIWPRLTTVKQPIAEMAQTAVDMISDITSSAWDGEPAHVTIDTIQIIERESLVKRS